jgi:hypothetical protein
MTSLQTTMKSVSRPHASRDFNHGVLGGVPLPRVPDHEERDLIEASVLVEDQILRQPDRLALYFHPAATLVVGRVSEDRLQVLVFGYARRGRG